MEAEKDLLVKQLTSEAHAAAEKLEALKHHDEGLVARVRFAAEALAAQSASERQLRSDVAAREAGRREEYEALAHNMRQEHKHLVATLKAKLGDGAKELGQARESYDRLVADHGKAAEANATQAKHQFMVEVSFLNGLVTLAKT